MSRSLFFALLFLAACGGLSSEGSMTAAEPSAPASDKTDDPSATTAASKASKPEALRTLNCTSGPVFQTFRATLDGTDFDPGSGLFVVRDATINDNYANATLHCTGNTPEEIDCIGFWFESSDEVVEVTTARAAGKLTASYHSLKGDLVKMHTAPWACTIN
jgi:hypothetical protein